MKLWEAMKALDEGKKVKPQRWIGNPGGWIGPPPGCNPDHVGKTEAGNIVVYNTDGSTEFLSGEVFNWRGEWQIVEDSPLPCPFCGSKPAQLLNGKYFCPRSNCDLSNEFTLEQWNKRAPR